MSQITLTKRQQHKMEKLLQNVIRQFIAIKGETTKMDVNIPMTVGGVKKVFKIEIWELF